MMSECGFISLSHPTHILTPSYPTPNTTNTGPARTEIWRLAVLYKHGGLYLDDDSTFTTPLDEIVSSADRLLVGRDEASYTDECWRQHYPLSNFSMNARFGTSIGINHESLFDNRWLFTWAMFASPGHPALKRIMEHVVTLIRAEYSTFGFISGGSEIGGNPASRSKHLLCTTTFTVTLGIRELMLEKAVEDGQAGMDSLRIRSFTASQYGGVMRAVNNAWSADSWVKTINSNKKHTYIVRHQYPHGDACAKILDGQVVKVPGQESIWIILNGFRHSFHGFQTFLDTGWDADYVQNIDYKLLHLIPKGEEVTVANKKGSLNGIASPKPKQGSGNDGDTYQRRNVWKRSEEFNRGAVRLLLELFSAVDNSNAYFLSNSDSSRSRSKGNKNRGEGGGGERGGANEVHHNPPLQTNWVVCYTRSTDASDLELMIMSWRMFRNPRVHSALLLILDEKQEISETSLKEFRAFRHRLQKISPPDTYFVDRSSFITETDVENIETGMHKRPGKTYGKMLMTKMAIDLAVKIAAKNNHVFAPDTISVIDSDAYWQTYVTPQAIFDEQNRIIVHGFLLNNLEVSSFTDIPTEKLLGNIPYVINTMLVFPITYLTSNFADTRNALMKKNNLLTTQVSPHNWTEVFKNVHDPFCEFCVMHACAKLYHRDKYSFSVLPIVGNNAKWNDNANKLAKPEIHKQFPESAPHVRLMVHNKRSKLRNRVSIFKGCCLSFQLSKEESLGKCVQLPELHAELYLDDPWSGHIPYTKPNMLTEHYANVTSEHNHPQLPREFVEKQRQLCIDYVQAVSFEGMYPPLESPRGGADYGNKGNKGNTGGGEGEGHTGGEGTLGPREDSTLDAFLRRHDMNIINNISSKVATESEDVKVEKLILLRKQQVKNWVDAEWFVQNSQDIDTDIGSDFGNVPSSASSS